MNGFQQGEFDLRRVWQAVRLYRRRWMLPALLIATAAMAYAALKPPVWRASQSLIVRNEAANNREGLGKFTRADEMKNAQETILELVRSQGVLGAALKEIGPPRNARHGTAQWPTARDIADFREKVELTPPKGAEFGSTEVFYLSVRDHQRGRAVALVAAICGQLEARYQRLRDAKAESMVAELGKAVQIARHDLDEATGRLAATEKKVGGDLAELRALGDPFGGESSLRRSATEIRSELRVVRAAEENNEQLAALLREAHDDPQRLVATPNRLLDSQPAVRRLKDGLIDAQLRTAELQGRMSDSHPLVIAARESEKKIHQHLRQELATAVGGVEAELRLDHGRRERLENKLQEIDQRLGQLAGIRAGYSVQLADAQHRRELVQQAEEELAEARIAQAGAKAASLIARIDAPEAGVHPMGPSRATIALAGCVGGLLAGLGLLVLTIPAAGAGVSGGMPAAGSSERPHRAEHDPVAGVVVVGGGHGLSLKQALGKVSPSHSAWN